MTQRADNWWFYGGFGTIFVLLAIGAYTDITGRPQSQFEKRVAELTDQYGEPPGMYCATFYEEVRLEPLYGAFSATTRDPKHFVCLMDGKEIHEWPQP